VAVMFDDMARTWEIVYSIAAASEDVRCTTGEYTEFGWCAAGQLPDELSYITQLMVPLLP
jgi:hypothetical protein